MNHLQNFLESYDIKIALLTGSTKAKEKRETYQKIKDGEVDIVIGTHAVIQDKVEYNKLALVITDEQHRFGVRQRESLSLKGEKPHVLVMSATPIPRTLAIIYMVILMYRSSMNCQQSGCRSKLRSQHKLPPDGISFH